MPRIMMITGAGRGIGRATAILAAKAGYSVCINYAEDVQSAEETCAECAGTGVAVTIFKANVADPSDVRALFAQSRQHAGACDRADQQCWYHRPICEAR